MSGASSLSSFCSPGELKALTKSFGDAAMASAFCERLANVATYDATNADKPFSSPIEDVILDMKEGVNTFFLVILGALVFIMHAGFAMVRLV